MNDSSIPAELTAVDTLGPPGPLGHPTGKGFYPTFHALWHLKALGVVSKLEPFSSDAWDAAKTGKSVRVAIIDTPIAYAHPNLTGAIDLGLMRDFSVHDEGAFVIDTCDLKDATSRQEIAAKIGGRFITAAEQMFIDETEGRDTRPPSAPRYFGAHGTALAGLVGGRPVITAQRKAAFAGQVIDPASDASLNLPYAGINPYCSIVPISTTASPDAEMVLAAINYALLIEPGVVVIAAAWDDNAEYTKDGKKWAAVDDALMRLCETAVVLCAAGNSGDTELAYPASLCSRENGPIAVTAVDAKNNICAYAPKLAEDTRAIRALSSSAERYDDEGIVIDPWKTDDPLIVQARDAHPGSAAEHLPIEALISLDVPGPYGYNPSPYHYNPPMNGPHLEIGSLYCRFSGTSAATAVAAGLVSLSLQSQTMGAVSSKGPWQFNKNLFTLAEAGKINSERGDNDVEGDGD